MKGSDSPTVRHGNLACRTVAPKSDEMKADETF